MMILLTFSVSTLREKVGLCTPYLFGYNTGSRAKVPQLWDLFDSKECKQTSCYGCIDFMVRLMVNSTVYVHVCQGSRNILGTDHDMWPGLESMVAISVPSTLGLAMLNRNVDFWSGHFPAKRPSTYTGKVVLLTACSATLLLCSLGTFVSTPLCLATSYTSWPVLWSHLGKLSK